MSLRKANRREFLSAWTVPTIAAVSLPEHAQATDGIVRALNVVGSNVTCDDLADPSLASFTLCNEEKDSVSVFGVESPIFGGISTLEVDPPLPFSIPIGGCLYVTVSLSSCPQDTGMTFEARLENTLVKGFFSVVF